MVGSRAGVQKREAIPIKPSSLKRVPEGRVMTRAKRGFLFTPAGRLYGFLNTKREMLRVSHPPFTTSHPERSRRIHSPIAVVMPTDAKAKRAPTTDYRPPTTPSTRHPERSRRIHSPIAVVMPTDAKAKRVPITDYRLPTTDPIPLFLHLIIKNFYIISKEFKKLYKWYYIQNIQIYTTIT